MLIDGIHVFVMTAKWNESDYYSILSHSYSFLVLNSVFRLPRFFFSRITGLDTRINLLSSVFLRWSCTCLPGSQTWMQAFASTRSCQGHLSRTGSRFLLPSYTVWMFESSETKWAKVYESRKVPSYLIFAKWIALNRSWEGQIAYRPL